MLATYIPRKLRFFALTWFLTFSPGVNLFFSNTQIFNLLFTDSRSRELLGNTSHGYSYFLNPAMSCRVHVHSQCSAHAHSRNHQSTLAQVQPPPRLLGASPLPVCASSPARTLAPTWQPGPGFRPQQRQDRMAHPAAVYLRKASGWGCELRVTRCSLLSTAGTPLPLS